MAAEPDYPSGPLRPVLDGDWWMAGDNPDLRELQGLSPGQAAAKGKAPQECVDHHFLRAVDGRWHLWGCIRNTAVGRLLYHWRADRLTDEHWERTGELIRRDLGAGECLDEPDGQEWLQSPFFVHAGGLYYMFYGGHRSGLTGTGEPAAQHAACQMCLMTSPDGLTWARHRNPDGTSRLFIGPGSTRDPCVLRDGDRWLMYHAGCVGGVADQPAFFVRTSDDLLHWSDARVCHQDLGISAGPWDTECPHVVRRGSHYYLLRTEDYASARTHAFRSTDPLDFGVGDASGHYVGTLAVAAPEIILTTDGEELISSNHDLTGGTRLCRLKWVAD